ncbi:MAG: cardiolipin synthase [Eubacterium sp.]|nr:cardiolipin synthase [Eubacterium sp.]
MEDFAGDEVVCRLAKPRKKGLLSLIFSRFMIIAVLLVLEVALIVSIYFFLYEHVKIIRAALTIFMLVMEIYLFNCDIDASGKLTWMLLLSIIPIPGAIMFFYTQSNPGHRKIMEREAELIKETRAYLDHSEEVMDALEKDGGDTDDLVKYLNHSGCFPAFDQTKVKYFPLGEDKFEAMLEELEKAERFIFMEYFIVEEGYMWGKILEILLRKAAEGVDVRVMYDGMCEMSTLPPDYWKLLEQRGIHAKPFSPIKPVLSTHYNYRDHRKILVIDGKTGFTGGVNLADEYINRIERFGHWKDTAVMLQGDAVQSLTLMFLQMWNIDEESAEFLPYLESGREERSGVTEPVLSGPLDGYVIPYCDNPMDSYKVGETVYMDMLNRAGSYVHIMTPYLILDGELAGAMKYAAQRGVEVKLILPGIPDKKMAFALAKTHYRELTEAGVKIYEYTPGFIHAKVVVSDDEKAVVGTINMDYRSLYHHFECAAYLYKNECIADIEQDFQETLAKCRKVTRESIRKEKISYKLMGSVMKLIAPLM